MNTAQQITTRRDTSAALDAQRTALDTPPSLMPKSPRGGQWLWLSALFLLYPVAIWWLLPHWGSDVLLALGALLLALRAWRSGQWLVHGLLALPIAVLLACGEPERGLRLYPVIANLAMCWLFASSLYSTMPLIERLARLREPELPPSGVRYTRRVTQVWSIFFAANALIALWTALYADLATWTLYNGALSYVLSAALMAVELIVRQCVRKRSSS